MCAKTSIDDYENLCRLDVLGVTDIPRDDITDDSTSRFQGLTDQKQGWLVRNWDAMKRQFYCTANQ